MYPRTPPTHFRSDFWGGTKGTRARTGSPLLVSPFSRTGQRLRTSKLSGIADGLNYLHSRDAFHGDLKGVRNLLKTHLTIALTSG